MHNVYVLGSINMDLVINASRRPKAGETVRGENFFTNSGGKGANQAVASARAGANTYFCGYVGNDFFGDNLKKDLEKYGVRTDYTRQAESGSGVAVITVAEGNNTIVLHAGANALVDIPFAKRCLENAAEGDVLLLQQEIPIPTVSFALAEAKRRGMRTLLNPAPAQGSDLSSFAYADLIIPNETEAMEITGEHSCEAAAEKLAETGGTGVVTMGGEGVLLCARGGIQKIPCPKVRAVDTTAAGDTLCGSLAARLCRGEKLQEALRYAVFAASLAVTRRGAQQSVPAEEEVLRFLHASE